MLAFGKSGFLLSYLKGSPHNLHPCCSGTGAGAPRSSNSGQQSEMQQTRAVQDTSGQWIRSPRRGRKAGKQVLGQEAAFFPTLGLKGDRDRGFTGFNSSHLVKNDDLCTYRDWAYWFAIQCFYV